MDRLVIFIVICVTIPLYIVALLAISEAAVDKGYSDKTAKIWFLGILSTPLLPAAIVATLPDKRTQKSLGLILQALEDKKTQKSLGLILQALEDMQKGVAVTAVPVVNGETEEGACAGADECPASDAALGEPEHGGAPEEMTMGMTDGTGRERPSESARVEQRVEEQADPVDDEADALEGAALGHEMEVARIKQRIAVIEREMFHNKIEQLEDLKKKVLGGKKARLRVAELESANMRLSEEREKLAEEKRVLEAMIAEIRDELEERRRSSNISR